MMRMRLMIAASALLLGGCYPGYVNGQPWDEERQCWGAWEAAGTSWESPWGGADQSITYAKSPEGRFWRFSQVKYPDDFELVDDQSVESGFPQSYEDCP